MVAGLSVVRRRAISGTARVADGACNDDGVELARIAENPPEMQEALDLGIHLFAGAGAAWPRLRAKLSSVTKKRVTAYAALARTIASTLSAERQRDLRPLEVDDGAEAALKWTAAAGVEA